MLNLRFLLKSFQVGKYSPKGGKAVAVHAGGYNTAPQNIIVFTNIPSISSDPAVVKKLSNV